MMAQLTRIRAHAFALMLPILWSRWDHFGGEHTITTEPMRSSECLGGIPLYTFDQHTSLGKTAIARFACQNQQVAALLRKWVPEHRRADVAGIAAFYADAAAVQLAFRWPTGDLLSQMGAIADMSGAGCALDGAAPILATVSEQLAHLNWLRRSALQRGLTSNCN